MEIQAELFQPASPQSRISELADKAKEQIGDAQFMEPGQKAKKGAGRPKGSTKDKSQKTIGQAAGTTQPKEEPKPHGIPTAQIVKPLVNLISSAGTAYVEDERARMKPEELEAGAQALGMVLDKWGPGLITNWGPEIMFGMIFGQYGLRIYAMKKLKDIEALTDKINAEKNNYEKEPNVGTPDSLKVQ